MPKSSYHKILFLLFILNLPLRIPLFGQVYFPFNSSFRLLKGKGGDTISANWYSPAYNDNSWTVGPAPFWYGDGVGGTQLNDMQNNYSTIYLRTTFQVAFPEFIPYLEIFANYDDGFIIWINGKEVARENAPVIPSFNAFAPDNHESGLAEAFKVDSSEMNLIEGDNLLAVQVFNVSLESSDFHFNVSLSAERGMPEFPDTVEVLFSHESGYYTEPFTLQVASTDPSDEVWYTLDGSHPGYSGTAVKIDGASSILIDPSSTERGGMTPAIVVRTAARKSGFKPSHPSARTFIFLQSVINQDNPGGNWPTENINNQIIDYPMDPEITLSQRYSSLMEESLLDLPAISVITDLGNLFDPATGIYVNAWGHGQEWERECSVEMIYPDSVSFSTNAGLRIRGGWSRHPDFPKHSFRLFFRSEYGDGKLNYPLFGDEGTDEYDKIDLRTSQNYAWANGDSRNTMLRDVFSRDLQRDMGQPYTRSRYFHLYLNGMYWGVYQTQERSEARFASSYFGDSPDDYDVVKVNTEGWTYRIEATDGNLDLWQQIYNMTLSGFGSMGNYYRLEGKGPDGKPDKNLNKLVDIDNLIDYMIGIFYTGNFDSPTSSFGGNDGCNNFFAIKERDNPLFGFVFFNHDAEHTLFYDPAPPGTGIEEDRVNLATRTDYLRMTLNSFSAFHPQWLHYKLTSNEEYRIRFNDRVYQCLKPGGVITRDQSLERLNKRADELYKGIVAESARWGDTKQSYAYNREDHWVPEVNKIRNNYFVVRPAVLMQQLLNGGLYSKVQAPGFKLNNETVKENVISFSTPSSLVITNPGGSGEIYYTVNGSDPRLSGGAISGEAKNTGSNPAIEVASTTVVKARVWYNGTWSALGEIRLMKEKENYSGLKVTELHYHPLDSISGIDTLAGADFEFVEFKNTGETAINLTGLRLDSAIRYTFPQNTVLYPKDFFVIASKPAKFFRRYGLIPSGNYKGNLSDNGEVILLEDSTGKRIMYFGYSNAYSWPAAAGGSGYSLVPVKANPEIFPGLPEYWRASAAIGGSPFSNDGNSELNTVKDHVYPRFTVFPNPATSTITIELDNEVPLNKINMEFFDLSGKLTYRTTAFSGQPVYLRDSGISPGIYILNISTDNLRERHKIVFLGE